MVRSWCCCCFCGCCLVRLSCAIWHECLCVRAMRGSWMCFVCRVCIWRLNWWQKKTGSVWWIRRAWLTLILENRRTYWLRLSPVLCRLSDRWLITHRHTQLTLALIHEYMNDSTRATLSQTAAGYLHFGHRIVIAEHIVRWRFIMLAFAMSP